MIESIISPSEPAIISLTSSPSSGDIVTLTCTVTLPSGVTDTPVFQWEGPGGVIPTPEDSMTNGQTVSSDLILTAITTSQAGQYICTATLSIYTYNDSINITVQSKFNKPLIVNDDYNISIYNSSLSPYSNDHC